MTSAKPLRKIAAISVGLIGALAVGIHFVGGRVQVEWPSIGLLQPASAAEGEGARDAMPRGRRPAAIVDGEYPASYFPNTELLGADEMRITALGTGMPNLTRAAASISYLVELGNGDKFLFDIGAGSMANLFSLRPDFSKIDKVFASHLHVDHVGDFMGLHIGSWLSGRYTPIHVYGPERLQPGAGDEGLHRGHEDGLRMGHRTPHRCAARRGWTDRGARVRLPAGERDRLPGRTA